MNQENITLKEAAEKLDINYSTAKTIVQTYRRENRISKKPKHTKATQKSLKREMFLSRVLTQRNVAKLMSRIVATEFKTTKRRKTLKEKVSSQAVSDARTLAGTGQALENPMSKGFPRVESAGQMQLFEAEVEGPRVGQVTRAVLTEIPLHHKKNIFYIHSESNAEEFKQLIDSKEQVNEKQEDIKNSNCPPPISAFNLVQRKEEGAVDGKLMFDFRSYGEMIIRSAYMRYMMLGNKIEI